MLSLSFFAEAININETESEKMKEIIQILHNISLKLLPGFVNGNNVQMKGLESRSMHRRYNPSLLCENVNKNKMHI